MGQKIELKATSFHKNIIFDLNRSLSGQDGVTYHNIADASLHNEVSAQLALRLFKYSQDIESIFIQSNVVTVNFDKNLGTGIEDFSKQIEDFFLFYGEEEFAGFQLFKKEWEVWFVPAVLVHNRVD